MSEDKQADVARICEELRRTLVRFAGELSDISFNLKHGKAATAAMQGASELYKAVSFIKGKTFKKDEDTAPVRRFLEKVTDKKLSPDTYVPIGEVVDSLAVFLLSKGHKELCGHLRGAITYFYRLHRLYCQSQGLPVDDTLCHLFYNRIK